MVYARRDAYEKAAAPFLPPETSEALKALEAAVAADAARHVRDARARKKSSGVQALAKQFKLNAWYRGNGAGVSASRRAAGQQAPLFVPLNFPDAPNVGTIRKRR